MENDEPVAIPGIVLQEVLSGVRDPVQFENLAKALAPFPLVLATRADHLLAADLANLCGRRGIASTAPDCLIAAQAIERQASLLTTDADFGRMALLCDLSLLQV